MVTDTAVSPRTAPEGTPQDLSEVVARAQQEGIVSAEQAQRILALAPTGQPIVSTTPDVEPRAGHLAAYVAEALGYVGGVMMLVAGLFVAQQLWVDLPARGHAFMLAVLVVALLSAGAMVHGEPGTPLGRLGSFLWLLAVAAVAGMAAVVAEEMAGLEEAVQGIAITVPTTAVAMVLWVRRRRSLQEIAVFAGLLATGASLLALVDADLEVWGGLLVWTSGVAWVLLAGAGVVRPARTGLVVGAVAALQGPLMMGDSGSGGVLLGVITAGALVVASVALRETILLGLGVLGLFVFIPLAVFDVFGDQFGAPVALLLSGGLLLGIALWVARTRGGGTQE